jgi:hypothetical protein
MFGTVIPAAVPAPGIASELTCPKALTLPMKLTIATVPITQQRSDPLLPIRDMAASV